MGQQNLTIGDFFLTPIYIIILSAIAKRQRDKRYPPGHPLRPYYMQGLYAKFAGAIFIALIYQFYYGGGDTYNYFYHTKIINSALSDSFTTWFKLIMRTPPGNDPNLYAYTSQMFWYSDPAAYKVAAIAAVFGLLNGTTYMPIALLFAFFSYTGVWAMYRTFANIYPALYKQLAIAFLFIPSTVVWGSAVFKDTICMFGLGWLVYTTFRVFVNRDFSFKNLFLLALSFYFLATIKLYILLAFIPALSLWLLLSNARKIKSAAIRWVINISFIGATIGGFFFFTQKFAKELDKYSLEKVAETASTTRFWIGSVSDEAGGAGYDLGEFDPSISGMITKFPQAVVVTLFRPFPWEVRKVIVALSALESLLFLYFTLKMIFTAASQALKLIRQDPTIVFCLTFSIIFAFAVGITSYNFGALSRYKIPCMPFYTAFLMIVTNKLNVIKTAKAAAAQKQKRAKPQWAA